MEMLVKLLIILVTLAQCVKVNNANLEHGDNSLSDPSEKSRFKKFLDMFGIGGGVKQQPAERAAEFAPFGYPCQISTTTTPAPLMITPLLCPFPPMLPANLKPVNGHNLPPNLNRPNSLNQLPGNFPLNPPGNFNHNQRPFPPQHPHGPPSSPPFLPPPPFQPPLGSSALQRPPLLIPGMNPGQNLPLPQFPGQSLPGQSRPPPIQNLPHPSQPGQNPNSPPTFPDPLIPSNIDPSSSPQSSPNNPVDSEPNSTIPEKPVPSAVDPLKPEDPTKVTPVVTNPEDPVKIEPTVVDPNNPVQVSPTSFDPSRPQLIDPIHPERPLSVVQPGMPLTVNPANIRPGQPLLVNPERPMDAKGFPKVPSMPPHGPMNSLNDPGFPPNNQLSPPFQSNPFGGVQKPLNDQEFPNLPFPPIDSSGNQIRPHGHPKHPLILALNFPPNSSGNPHLPNIPGYVPILPEFMNNSQFPPLPFDPFHNSPNGSRPPRPPPPFNPESQPPPPLPPHNESFPPGPHQHPHPPPPHSDEPNMNTSGFPPQPPPRFPKQPDFPIGGGGPCGNPFLRPYVPPGFHLSSVNQFVGMPPSHSPKFNSPCPTMDLLKTLDFKVMRSLILSSGLVPLFEQTRNYTIFVPSDAAFRRLPRWFRDSLEVDKKLKKALVLNHLVKEDLPLAMLENEELVLSARPGGNRLRINIYQPESTYRTITVDGSEIEKGDILTSQGRIHIVNKVLMPNLPRNGAQFLSEKLEFEGFWNLVKQADLVPKLQDASPFTLFIPLNDGIQKLNDTFLFSDIDKLKNFVNYHVVNGTFFSAGIINNEFLLTNYEKEIKMQVAGDGFAKSLSGINGRVKILKPDISLTNGVAHIIDQCISDETPFYVYPQSDEFKNEYGVMRRSFRVTGKEKNIEHSF